MGQWQTSICISKQKKKNIREIERKEQQQQQQKC